MNRIKELDLVKAFNVVVSMIAIHVVYHLADLEPSLFSVSLNVLATDFCAPVFMFCLGMTLGFSRHQDAASWLHRGVRLLTLGLFLNVLRYVPSAFAAFALDEPARLKDLAQIFNVDIMPFAGLAFMLLALCRRLRLGRWQLLGLALALNVAGSLLTGVATPCYAVNQLLGFFYHTPSCSCFPLMNWFIFVAAGNVLGAMYRECDDVDRLWRWLLPLCGAVTGAYQWLSLAGCPLFKTLQNDWEFYSMATPDALCVAFGVAPFMLGLFRLLGRALPERWMGVLSYPSRHINEFYCVSWVCIMWVADFLLFVPLATSVGAFLLRYLAIVAMTTAVVLLYNGRLKARWLPFFDRHAALCYAAVWVGLVAFGVWFFSCIPLPYTMPY